MARLTDTERTMFDQYSLDYRFCWACGIPNGRTDSEIDYPRNLERAHIIGGSGRVHDRRNLAMLCQLCHHLSHGHTIAFQGVTRRRTLPKLRLDHILWLQYRFEGQIDREFLRSLRSRPWLPTPRIVPAWHLANFHRWQGVEHSQWRSERMVR